MVELLESATLGLGKAEEAEQGTQAANTREDESNLAAEVRLVLIDEEWDSNGQRDGTDLVKGGGEADVEATQASRRHLGHEDEAVGADGDVVDEVASDNYRALAP